MTAPHPPRRVVVTGPRSRTVRRAPGRSGVQALDEQTVVGDLLVRSLLRAQLTLALRTAAAVALPLGGLPLLFALAPALRQMRVLGVSVPWLLLGVVVYPALLLAGWVHVRLAERNERDFVELVERS